MAWSMPKWMEKYCGDYLKYDKQQIETHMNTGSTTHVLNNAPLTLIIVGTKSRVELLERLHHDGILCEKNLERNKMHNQINDLFVDIFGRVPTNDEIKFISNVIPSAIHEDAIKWGWEDTEVRESLYIWLKDKMDKSLLKEKEGYK
ncbi:hypothetical protein MOF23_22430 [Bacillus inaquosorum]|uniref:hypothetical protein n=1 Tax=Bacillus inaquosorum TaxID=483913 RepID=UPI00227DC025|nr:hypothetical protein [Bacillus inaquosorum]MCY9311692.1 hypothetical protein [Bacillus inaquosorum]